MTIQFINDGTLTDFSSTTGETLSNAFTMTCGGLTIDSSENLGNYLTLYEVKGGLPASWTINAYSTDSSYRIYSTWGSSGQENVRYYPTSAVKYMSGTNKMAWTKTEASTVPLPPAALLFGAGLLRLAWTRRRKGEEA